MNMNLDEKRDLQRYIDMAVDKGLVLDRDVTDIGAQIKKYMDREQGVEKVQNIRRCTDIRYGILPPQQKKSFAFKMTAKLVSHSAQELLTLGPNTQL